MFYFQAAYSGGKVMAGCMPSFESNGICSAAGQEEVCKDTAADSRSDSTKQNICFCENTPVKSGLDLFKSTF